MPNKTQERMALGLGRTVGGGEWGICDSPLGSFSYKLLSFFSLLSLISEKPRPKLIRGGQGYQKELPCSHKPPLLILL